MKLADDPVVRVGEPVACLQQLVGSQTPILLAGLLKVTLTGEQDVADNAAGGSSKKAVSLLSL